MNSDIPILEAFGTYYEVGYQVGKAFRERILKFIAFLKFQIHMSSFNFVETETGKKYLQEYVTIVEENFPQYADEIQGMADGSGIPITQIYALNLTKNELERNSDITVHQGADHCTDLIINNNHCTVIAHNEDSYEGIDRLGYILKVHITDKNERGNVWVPEERFVAYCAPGRLAGSFFGFNHHGITHSGNCVSPPLNLPKGTPYRFLMRATLAARSFEEIETICRDEGRGASYGFVLNFGNTLQESPRIFCSIEVAPDERNKRSKVMKTVIHPNSDPYFQVNLYKHLNIEGQGKDVFGQSSYFRMKRFSELTTRTLEDAINVISDTQGVDGNVKDTIYNSDTMATAVFDFNRRTLSVYNKRPATSQPIHVFNLPRTINATSSDVELRQSWCK